MCGWTHETAQHMSKVCILVCTDYTYCQGICHALLLHLLLLFVDQLVNEPPAVDANYFSGGLGHPRHALHANTALAGHRHMGVLVCRGAQPRLPAIPQMRQRCNGSGSTVKVS